MLLKQYMENDNTDTDLFSPRVFQAYRALQDLSNGGDNDKTFNALTTVAKNVDVRDLKLVRNALMGTFRIKGLEYSINDLYQLVKDVAYPRTKKATEEAAELLHDTLLVVAKPVNSFADYLPDAGITFTPNRALEKYIAWLESQTYKGIWSDIMTYPFENGSNNQIRKHLMIGFAPSTGKTIITNALSALYRDIAINIQARSSFSFDAGSWNAAVNEKFLVITDDDNEEQPISQDFIKNFMNENMAQMQASQGVRTFKTYQGSSVIATNSEEDYFAKPQVSKRIILIRLDNPMPEFTPEELQELHTLDLRTIVSYVNLDRRSRLFAIENKWNNNLKTKVSDAIEYVNANQAVKAGDLKRLFGADIVKMAYPNGARNKTVAGVPMYGYFAADTPAVTQQEFDEFDISMFKGLTDTQPHRIHTTFNSLAYNIEAAADTPKQEQAMFAMFYGDGIKTADVTEAGGVILDIDDSKFKSLAEIKLPYAFLAYETSSSTPEQLRYRLIIPGIKTTTPDEYKRAVEFIAGKLGDNIDTTGEAMAHRYFIGGKNIRINRRTTTKTTMPSNNSGIIDAVKNAAVGTRNDLTYWALKRAQEKNDEDLAELILAVSPVDEKEKEIFAARWDKGNL